MNNETKNKVTDRVGNELHVGDEVYDLKENVVCKIVKLWNKSVTTDLQLERENEKNEYYGDEPTDAEHCGVHKLASGVIRIKRD